MDTTLENTQTTNYEINIVMLYHACEWFKKRAISAWVSEKEVALFITAGNYSVRVHDEEIYLRAGLYKAGIRG